MPANTIPVYAIQNAVERGPCSRLPTTLAAAPAAQRFMEQVAQGLAVLPGVHGCAICVNYVFLQAGCPHTAACPSAPETSDTPFTACATTCPFANWDDGWRKVELRTPRGAYGALFLQPHDETVLTAYLPLVDHIGNLVALELENAWIAAELRTRQQAAEAQRRREALQHVLTDMSSTGTTLVDRITQTIQRVNQYAATLVGDPPARLVDRQRHAVTCPHEAGACPFLARTETAKPSQIRGREKLLDSFLDVSARKPTKHDEQACLALLPHASTPDRRQSTDLTAQHAAALPRSCSPTRTRGASSSNRLKPPT